LIDLSIEFEEKAIFKSEIAIMPENLEES